MGITGLLDALVTEHDRIGSSLRRELGPGLPPERVEAVVRDLGLIPPASLIELHSWHQVHLDPGAPNTTWFWPADPLTLDEAVAQYRQWIEIGGIAPAAIEAILARPLPVGATNTGYWRTDWFPILAASPGYAIECSREGAEDAPIWRVNWHPVSGDETMQVASSLEWFIGAIVDLFRAGAYRWDPQHHAVVTVDAVFEERGLGEYFQPPAASDG